jgi:virulence-associated protein VapD
MSTKKRIKIFTAFDKDVEEDVVRFGDFLCELNAQCTGIEFSIFKSEKEFYKSLKRSKKQINSGLETCENFLLILGCKNDEFALDKLNRTIERYAKTHGNLNVYIFVNAANKDAEKVITFFASEKYKHYIEQFKHLDILKAKLLIWLSEKYKEFAFIETNKMIAEQAINILFAEIDRLKLDKENKNRFKEIEKCYADIENFQEKLGLEITVLFEYAFFLGEHNIRGTAIEKYSKELARLRKLSETSPDTYLPNLAMTLNNLAILQKAIFHYFEAEGSYTEALEIRRKLAESCPDVYLPYLAQTLINLANLQYYIRHYTEAQSNYSEALKIVRQLVEAIPDECISDLEKTLNNLQSDIESYKEKEGNLIEAIEIQRKLTETNPDKYYSDLAEALDKLANFQLYYASRYLEAEDSYAEVLEIRRKLAETNPDVYLPVVATTLINLAHLHEKTKRNMEAEANYKEALEIRRKLAKTNSNVYLPDVAQTLYNLGTLLWEVERYSETEDCYSEAISIYRDLPETKQDYIDKIDELEIGLAAMERLGYI